MKKKAAPYVITIDMGDLPFVGEGATAYDALKAIGRPSKITTKTLVTLAHKGKTASRLFMPFAAKRLFYPFAQPYLAKQLELLLK